MKISLNLLLVGTLFLIASCGCEHAHCDDTEVKRIPSPDGKQAVVIYNRSCSSGTGLYTWANLEDPSLWFSKDRRQRGCPLLTLSGGYHQLNAVWKNASQVELSSTDELERKDDVSYQNFPCNGITLSYNFKFKPPPVQWAPDEKTVKDIREVLKQTHDCAKSNPSYENYLWILFNNGQHRDVLELLCKNLSMDKCPISPETFEHIERAVKAMGIDSGCLEKLQALVQR